MSELLRNVLGVQPDHAKYISSDVLPSNTKVGVEVELERVRLRGDEHMKYWKITRDGSLRDSGIEFVMAFPTCGQTLLDAFEELKAYLGTQRAVASDRTSTHVHLDFRDSSVEQTFQFCMVYAILEKTLFKYAGGVEREDSIYCIPLYKSYEAMRRISLLNEKAIALKNPKSISRYVQRDVQWAVGHAEKYAALNIRPLATFGSIEVRIHKGETDSDKILDWVKLLLTIKKYTDNVEIDFEGMFSEMSCSGCCGLLEEIFGKEGGTLEYFSDIPNKEEDLAHGMRVAQDIFNLYNMNHRSRKPLGKGVMVDGTKEHPLKKKGVARKKPVGSKRTKRTAVRAEVGEVLRGMEGPRFGEPIHNPELVRDDILHWDVNGAPVRANHIEPIAPPVNNQVERRPGESVAEWAQRIVRQMENDRPVDPEIDVDF